MEARKRSRTIRVIAVAIAGLFTGEITAAEPRSIALEGQGAAPESLIANDAFLYFTADDGLHGRELWRMGHDESLQRLSDVITGPGATDPKPFAVGPDSLLYEAMESPDGSRRLQVVDRLGNTRWLHPYIVGLEPFHAVWLNGLFLLSARTPAHGQELWSVNPENATVRLVRDIRPGPESSIAFEGLELVTLGNKVLFTAESPEVGHSALWQTDGTTEGTTPISNDEGEFIANYNWVTGIVFGSDYVFPVLNSDPTPEPMITDGTIEGTRALTVPGTIAPDVKGQFAATESLVFFQGYTADHGAELWCTDGTPEGTRLVSDIYPGPQGAAPYAFVALGESVVFVADHPDYGAELWRSDGTEAGTTLLSDLMPGLASSEPYQLTACNDYVLFSCENRNIGEELWRTDGTPEGTVLVRDINPEQPDSEPYYLTPFNGRVYFQANHAAYGPELWESDGTREGTRLAARIRPDFALVQSSDPARITAAGDTLYFTAGTMDGCRNLWAVDAHSLEVKEALHHEQLHELGWVDDFSLHEDGLLLRMERNGETQVFEFDPAAETLDETDLDTLPGTETPIRRHLTPEVFGDWFPYGVDESEFVVMDGYTAFAAHRHSTGVELWRMDHDSGEITLVRDIFPGVAGSSPSELTRIDHRFVFRAEDPNKGAEMFASDGTPEGTWLVRDFRPSPLGSTPGYFTVAGDTLFAVGRTAPGMFEILAYELPSLRLLHSLTPEWLQSRFRPTEMCAMGDLLFFVADHFQYGTELWVSDETRRPRLLRDLVPNVAFDPLAKAWRPQP